MLTAQGPFVNLSARSAEWSLSVLAGALLLGVLGAMPPALKALRQLVAVSLKAV